MSEGDVVDASVAVKWVIREERSAQAQALYEATVATHALLAAPSHLTSEVANALYCRSLRTGLTALTDDEGRRAIAHFLRLRMQVIAEPSVYEETYTFARAFNLASIYASLYVVLARHLGTELWTAGQRLLTAVGSVAPWVHWIGDYRP